jgi:hypothetical protein
MGPTHLPVRSNGAEHDKIAGHATAIKVWSSQWRAQKTATLIRMSRFVTEKTNRQSAFSSRRMPGSRPKTRQIRTSDQNWAHSVRKRWPYDDGGKSLVCRTDMCLDTSEPDALLRAQNNDDHCNQLTMPLISTQVRVRRHAAQVHGQSRGESYLALRLLRLVQLSISRAISASCDSRIFRSGLLNGRT